MGNACQCERQGSCTREGPTLSSGEELGTVNPAPVRNSSLGSHQNASTRNALLAELAAMEIISYIASKGDGVMHPQKNCIGVSMQQMQQHLPETTHAGFCEWLTANGMQNFKRFDKGTLWLDKTSLIAALDAYFTTEARGKTGSGRPAKEATKTTADWIEVEPTTAAHIVKDDSKELYLLTTNNNGKERKWNHDAGVLGSQKITASMLACVLEIFDSLDKDGDEKVTKAEFVGMLQGKTQEDNEIQDDFLSAFEDLDTDHSGALTLEALLAHFHVKEVHPISILTTADEAGAAMYLHTILIACCFSNLFRARK